MTWLRRLQIRHENYPSASRYRQAITLYFVLGVPLVLLNILGHSALRGVLTVVALAVFLVVDFRILRRG